MLVLVAVLIMTFARVGAGQVLDAPPPQTEGVTIDAQSLTYDEPTKTVTAIGDVVVRHGDTELRAERVEVNNETRSAYASGGVLLTSPDATLSAREMELNLDDETGTLVDGWVRSERHAYSLRGDRIEKDFGQHYRIENGQFTTCNCDGGAPSWSLSARRVDVELDGYGRLNGGTFNVLDVPVFYLPKAIFPVTRERQTGFLLPHFGFSNRRGFQSIFPFYLVIDRSHDATVALDVETGARVGLLSEYRYAFSRETRGEVNFAYFNEFFRSARDREDTDPTIEVDRWDVVGHHSQRLPFGVRGYGDVFLLSDDLFLREIDPFRIDGGRDVLNRTRRYTESRLAAVRTWERAAVRLEGKYFQDLTQLDGFSRAQTDDLTLQELPELAVWGQHLLFGLAHTSLDATATSFQRDAGIDGLRVDLRPAVAVSLPVPQPLRASVHVGFRETAYALTQRRMRGGLDPESTGNFVLELPSSMSREIVELGGELSTELSRVYDVGGGDLKRLKHTIEPVLAYDYVPDVGQQDLPIFDDADRINRRNLLTFGVRSRLLGRYGADGDGGEGKEESAEPEIREIASLGVFQSFDVNREIAPVGEPPGGPQSDHLSDIDLFLRANPFRSTSLVLRSNYDTSDGDLSAAAVDLRFTDPRPERHRRSVLSSRTTATLGYRFITQNILHEVDASILLHLTDTIGALYATRYDVQGNRVLENHFGIRLLSSCDCWALDIGFTDKSNPNETELRAQLTLIGLGSSVSVGKGLE